jgi:hypothetical protein
MEARRSRSRRSERGFRRASLRREQGTRLGQLFEMEKRNAKKGLATLCIGGGMGIAMCLERA